jgi:hypothetical protein
MTVPARHGPSDFPAPSPEQRAPSDALPVALRIAVRVTPGVTYSTCPTSGATERVNLAFLIHQPQNHWNLAYSSNMLSCCSLIRLPPPRSTTASPEATVFRIPSVAELRVAADPVNMLKHSIYIIPFDFGWIESRCSQIFASRRVTSRSCLDNPLHWISC